MKSLLRGMTFCGISTSRTGCFLAWIFLTKMTEWRRKAANVVYLTCERAAVELSENNANFIAKVLILLKSNDFIAQRAHMPTGIARSAKKIWLKVPNFRSARLSCGLGVFTCKLGGMMTSLRKTQIYCCQFEFRGSTLWKHTLCVTRTRHSTLRLKLTTIALKPTCSKAFKSVNVVGILKIGETETSGELIRLISGFKHPLSWSVS